MFKLKPKKKIEPPPVYKFVPLKPNPALAMGAMTPATPAHKVWKNLLYCDHVTLKSKHKFKMQIYFKFLSVKPFH